MLKIWGRINSANVKKVVWVAQELALPFQRIDVGGPFGGVNTPEFLALNPNGTVPVIEDDDFVLWESNSIVRYLASKYGDGTLYPADLQQRADIERWLDWQTTEFHPTLVPAFLNLVRLPPEQRQPELAEKARQQLEPLAQLLDDQLAKRAYLSGDAFTVADLVVGCSVHAWFNLPLERVERPHLWRWYNALRARHATEGVLLLPLS